MGLAEKIQAVSLERQAAWARRDIDPERVAELTAKLDGLYAAQRHAQRKHRGGQYRGTTTAWWGR